MTQTRREFIDNLKSTHHVAYFTASDSLLCRECFDNLFDQDSLNGAFVQPLTTDELCALYVHEGGHDFPVCSECGSEPR